MKTEIDISILLLQLIRSN